jgi:hypothetical protein
MEYPNSGAIFTSTQKKFEKSPDMWGEIKIEKAYLLELIEKAKGESSVTVKLSGWLRKDKNGNRMVSLKVDTYQGGAAVTSSAKDPWDD